MAYGFGGRDWYGAVMDDRQLYDIYGKPWRAFIRDAGGRGAMMAHNEVNGEPLHGSRAIMTDVLRNWFGSGPGSNKTGDSLLLASDWGNVENNIGHGTSADTAHAAMQAAWAGLDNEMSPPPGAFITLNASAAAGLINMSYIDRAAGNNLREKFATGLFDGAWLINGSAYETQLDLPADRALAYEAAAEGIVLLQNEPVASRGGAPLLPLSGLGTTIKTVALLGPLGGCVAGERPPCLAGQGMVGHYVQMGARIVTPLDALSNISGLTITHLVGANIDDYDESGIAAAVAAASTADLVLLAVGDSVPISTGSCSEMSDSDTLDLPGGQLALLNAVAALNRSTVLMLFNCRPTTFGAGPCSAYGANNALLARLPAVVVGWRPGEEAGHAMIDVLTGAINPSGRLTQSWPRTSGAVHGPAVPYLQRRGALQKAYLTEPATPMFPFGYGLSYSKISVAGATLNGGSGGPLGYNDTFIVSGTVATAAGDPAARVSLLVFYSQNAPTKWVRYSQQLTGFGKFDVPANGGVGAPFSIPVRVRDFDAYEPEVEDFVVYTGTYTVTLGFSATETIASWQVAVNGTYSWTWDFAV